MLLGGEDFDAAETALEFGVGTAQGLLGIKLHMPREIGHGEKQIADLIGQPVAAGTIDHFSFYLSEFLGNLIENLSRFRPIEADPRGAFLQLGGPGQGGQGERQAVELAGGRPLGSGLCGPLARFLLFPGQRLGTGAGHGAIGEHMGMPADHLVVERPNNVVEAIEPALARHLGVEHDLKHQVAQLALEFVHLAALDGIGDFIGFLDRVRDDGREVLLEIPGTAGFGIAQPRHDGEEAVDRREALGRRGFWLRGCHREASFRAPPSRSGSSAVSNPIRGRKAQTL
jgi:hypothetical protein